MLVPAGRVKTMVQVLTAASLPLVTVTLPWWPEPQSDAAVKVAVTLPAAEAENSGTTAAEAATTTPPAPASRPRRRDFFKGVSSNQQLGNFPERRLKRP
jgi:hypothetical protein